MQKRKCLIIFSVFLAPLIYVFSCNRTGNPHIENELTFEKQLSFYKLFQGKMSELHPSADVALLELSSTLFTDYAEKQRLIRIPEGQKMILKGNGLPEFPEGTLIAKTFYYPSETGRKTQIVETRLLIFKASKWNSGTYKWNEDQREAFLIEDGATVPVTVKTLTGKLTRIAYHIPDQKECVSCHHSGNSILPIGPKVRNLNRTVEREGKHINQLKYLMDRGFIQSSQPDSFQRLPDYKDRKLHPGLRARAYLDVNCAHCHQPGGYAGQTTLDLDYGTDLDRTGIKFNRSNIIIRMSNMGEYHMPKLGTTVIDNEGLKLIKSYLGSIK